MNVGVSADQNYSFQNVVLSGEPASGVADGLSFASFAYPMIDNAGKVAFRGYVTGSGVDSTNNEGLWYGDANSLSLAVREGVQAPFTEPDTRLRLLGPVFYLGSDGTLGFNGALEGPNMPATGTTAMWGWKSNQTRLVARSGALAPGLDDGERFRALSTWIFTVASDGGIGFRCDISNSTFPPYFQQKSLWAERDGSLGLLVREGDPVPDVAPTATLVDPNFIWSSRIGTPSRIYHASMKGGILGGAHDFGLWVESNSSMSLVAYTGMPAPGFQDGRLLGNILSSRFSLNSSGQTAFTGFAANPSGGQSSYMVYSGSAGSLRFVAQDGDQAPGTAPGVRFDGMYSNNMQGLPISESGRTAFKTSLIGPGINVLTNSDAIYSEGFGTLELVARAGSQAPDASDGVLFDRFYTLDMFASGQAIFMARLRGSGVTSANNEGIWVQNPMGELTKLIRRGDAFEVGPGDVRTIGFYNFVFGPGMNERGELTIQLSFTDGSAGVFITQVPEPGTALLLATGVILGCRFRRVAIPAGTRQSRLPARTLSTST